MVSFIILILYAVVAACCWFGYRYIYNTDPAMATVLLALVFVAIGLFIGSAIQFSFYAM